MANVQLIYLRYQYKELQKESVGKVWDKKKECGC